MVKTNFSADEMKVFDLANDLARGDFSIHVDKEKVTRGDHHEPMFPFQVRQQEQYQNL